MAILDSYTQGGNREDLIDLVTTVARKETPLLSSMDVTRAKGTLHEFTTDTYRSPADNAHIEGAAASAASATTRVKLNNYTQIVQEVASVSDTQEIVDKAGVVSEMDYQILKKTGELARDMERVCFEGTKNAGASASKARRAGGLHYWATTNRTSMATSVVSGTCTGNGTTLVVNVAAGHGSAANDIILLTGGTGQGQARKIISVSTNALTVGVSGQTTELAPVTSASVATDNTTTYTIYKTPKALTFAVINAALATSFNAGGTPNEILVDSTQKQAISGFLTANRRGTQSDKKFTEAVDVLDTDFGTISVKYANQAPVSSVSIVESGKWRLANLRAIKPVPLAKVGSSTEKMIEAEFTIEALGENANAMIFGAL